MKRSLGGFQSDDDVKAVPTGAQPRKKRHRVMKSCVSCHANVGLPSASHEYKYGTVWDVRTFHVSLRFEESHRLCSCAYETEQLPSFAGESDAPALPETTRLRNRVAELESVVRQLKDRRPSTRPTGSSSAAFDPRAPSPSPSESSSFPEDEAACAADSTSHNGATVAPHHHPPVHAPPPGNTPSDSWCNVQLHGRGASAGQRPGQVLVGATAAPLLISKLDHIASSRNSITPEIALAGLFPEPSPRRSGDPLRWRGPVERAEATAVIQSLLPTLDEATAMIGIFQETVDLEIKCWHGPSLSARFTAFFRATADAQRGYDRSFLAFVVSILGLATFVAEEAPQQLSADQAQRLRAYSAEKPMSTAEGPDKSEICAFYTAAAMHLLDLADIATAPTVESLQARVCVGVYLTNSGYARLFANLLPVMVRDAQRCGLHIDPRLTYTAMPVVEAEIRRRLWWQVMDMDITTSLYMGWPPLIASNDSSLPSDRSEESLCGPNVTDEPDPLPQIGVTICSAIIYRLEVVLYAREVLTKAFNLTRWLWQPAAREANVPPLDEVGKIDAAIKIWYGRIPPALCFEIDPMPGTPIPEPRLGTRLRDLDVHGPELAMQTLLLAIHAHVTLLVLHKPYLQLAQPWHADLCIAAERQTFVSALTVVLARCRLGVVHFAFWVDGWAYMAALTLGQLWSRALAVRPLRHGELHALRAGLRAAIECFQHLPGGLDRSRSLGQLEDGLAAREHEVTSEKPPSPLPPPPSLPTPITPSNPRAELTLSGGQSGWSALRLTTGI